MIIVGFSDKTSLPVIRVLCGHFKHCVIITEQGKNMVLHQFIKRNYVVHIAITKRSIAQLMLNGWVFIYMPQSPVMFNLRAWTCVNYVKYAIGLRAFWIQTPNALYKYLKKI